MTRRSKLLVTVALGVVALVVLAAAGGFWWWSRGGRPQRTGEATAPVAAPVTVRWDARGVPYVEAASEDDLAAALGWLHANDRMTQMELGRRLAAGRIAELVGAAAVPVDTESRRMRFRAGAERLWNDAGPESRRWLIHYARGVNAWLAARGGDLPPGLRLLGGPRFEPEPWTPLDSLSFVFLMGQDLSFWAGRPEEERFRWLAALGEERVRDLLGGELHVPEEILELAAAAAAPPALAGRSAAAGGGSGGDVGSPGSNNWALAGERTASGAPLLANDPHLPLALPGTWFLVHLRAPGFETAGFTLPGVPGVVIGRGRSVAWAFTNVMLDDHDLFFERVERRPDGSEAVARGDAWRPVEAARETIAVDGGEPVEIEVRWTDHGPLLPAEPERGLPERSLAWTLHHGGDPLAAFLGLARAESLADVMAAIGSYTGPAQNVVAAHPDEGILWTVLGRVPARRAGDGRLPAPGWAAEYGWDGLRPRSASPAIVAPPDGLIVTANARVEPADHPFPMTADYDTAHRAERIRRRLLAGDGWDVAAAAALQLDVVSLYAREMLVHAIASLPAELSPDAAAARDLLGAWDGTTASRDAAGRPLPAAALFAFFARSFEEAVFADEEAAYGVEDLADRERLLWVLDGTMSEGWFDDVSTPEVETQGEVVAAALADAWRDAGAALGADPAGWDYEEMHQLRLAHPLGRAPVFGRFFDRGPFPTPGSATTVAAFGARWASDRQHVTYGPSMRWVVDLADPDSAIAVLPAGQSGHPFDPHYDDQIDAYREGRAYPFPWTAAAIERQSVERLVLRPVAR
ncbi:MAG TPA: penicillin acylase family protein [Thermoanaerobaculia bacterium]